MFTPWSELSTESCKNQLFAEFVRLLCLSRGKYHTFWEIFRSYDGINKYRNTNPESVHRVTSLRGRAVRADRT